MFSLYVVLLIFPTGSLHILFQGWAGTVYFTVQTEQTEHGKMKKESLSSYAIEQVSDKVGQNGVG